MRVGIAALVIGVSLGFVCRQRVAYGIVKDVPPKASALAAAPVHLIGEGVDLLLTAPADRLDEEVAELEVFLGDLHAVTASWAGTGSGCTITIIARNREGARGGHGPTDIELALEQMPLESIDQFLTRYESTVKSLIDRHWKIED